MAGDNIKVPLPFVESGQRYAAATLAEEVQNLALTPEGTLRGVRGPAPYIPNYGAGYPWPGRIYGVYHALLDKGQRDVVLVRSGTLLMEQAGWAVNTGGTRDLATGLSNEPNARFPDCFVEVAGKVVWSNGVDTPLIYDGYRLLPLGYDVRPGAPAAVGPRDTGHPVFRNAGGYSHPGKVGPVGNFFSTQSGAILAENYYYFVQFEDHFGNRSPLSAPGGPVVLRQEYTQSLHWMNYDNYTAMATAEVALYPGTPLGLLSVQLDDLTRQFVVTGIAKGPEGTKARILYRSSGKDPVPRQLARIDDNQTTVFPDNTPDSGLGAEAQDYIPVPTFAIACEHDGCLVIADGRYIRESEPGFPGTFTSERKALLPGDPTGLFSFAGKVYATTESAVFRIERTETALVARALPQGLGMVAPQSWDATAIGVCVGLGRDGWWSMDADENVRPLSDAIRPLFKRLNPAMLSRAVGKWHPERQAYLCAIPEAGAVGNTLVMSWDGAGWRRDRHSIAYLSMCVTKDWRRLLLAGGRQGNNDLLYALDREVGSYTPPTKTYAYRSGWLRMDALGRDRFNVDAIYIGYVETVKGQDLTVKVWRNGSRDTPVGPSAGHTVAMVAPKLSDGSAVTHVYGTFVLGTDRTRIPRLTWKRVDIRVVSVESFAFDLTSSYPFEISAFSFDAYPVDASGARVSRE